MLCNDEYFNEIIKNILKIKENNQENLMALDARLSILEYKNNLTKETLRTLAEKL